MPGHDGQARYVRAADVLWRRTAATVVLLAADDDEVFELGGTAVALWDALAEPATLEEATAQLAAHYGVAVGVVATDVVGAVEDLVRRRVLDVVGDV
ncbi:MAG: PqqD family protein [Acidimicrobiales bacterium]